MNIKSCLIVDDSRVVRTVARKILEELKFQVYEAEDGVQALNICANTMPDAVLLDWNMPQMNGIDFLRRLRQTSNGSKPKVIFCTTENDVDHIVEAMHLGADEYIMKPFDTEIIESKFNQVGLL